MKATKENLIKCLNKIGWTVRDHGCEYFYIYNHKGVNTSWYIRNDRVQLDKYVGAFDETPSCCFIFDSCYLQWLPTIEKRKTTICITAKGTKKKVWMYFANYELPKTI